MTVVYAATRNLYQYLPTAIGSLLQCHPEAKVYLFCEDDVVENLQDCKNIIFFNVNKLPVFVGPDSPNYNTRCTYMTLIRCFLPEILDEERILWLDVDTLVLEPINELWNVDLTNKAIAGWSEPVHQIKRKICFGYVNAGVLVMNLKFMREIKATERMIGLLNETFYPFADQDVLNIVCEGYISYVSYEYNWGPIAFKKDKELTPKIFHATFRKLWDGHRPELWKQYYKEKL